MAEQLIGAIEAGGTKMVCAVGTADGKVLDRASYPTRTPEETLPDLVGYFKDKDIVALGLAAFGPVAVNPSDPRFGRILNTPKIAWQNYDFMGELKRALNVPVGIDTDVNGACLGEITFGAAHGLTDVIYITVGTGVGVGVCIGGQMLHGMLHPEAGHVAVQRAEGDTVPSTCHCHDSCFEGVAAGPAVQLRLGEDNNILSNDPAVLEQEADYLAQGLATYVLCYSPQRIILGGGVPDHTPELMPLVRKKTLEKLNGYLSTPELDNIDTYIVPPSLDGNQGVLGSIELGRRALEAAE